MNANQLIDKAKIQVHAGNGGDGGVTFRREKYISKGGPDGGDGGKGGSVFFVADNNIETLMDFKAKAVFAAESGAPGTKKKMSGKDASDYYVKVPVGTLVYEEARRFNEHREKSDKEPVELPRILVADLNTVGKTFLIARGGRGGKGNFRFRSSVNQTPTQYTKGDEGEKKTVWLEVKLVADVGLVGLPNAGKSTLLNVLTNSHAKVSNYPFTTLHPNLGSYKTPDGQEIIFEDIPGLIEGASEGKGLGDEFLRHVERTRILIHLIDPSDFSYTGLDANKDSVAKNAYKMYEILRQELGGYGAGLTEKPEIIVINKIDLPDVSSSIDAIKSEFAGKRVFFISGATKEGLVEVLNTVQEELSKISKIEVFDVVNPVKIYTINDLPNKRLVYNSKVRDWEEDKLAVDVDEVPED
jgi:GTP-binding protein